MEFKKVYPDIIAYCRTLDSAEIERLPFRKQIFPELPNAWLANQAGLQKLAEKKLPPDWLGKNMLMPDRQAIEQCTSALVARWKKGLIPAGINLLADASSGLGMDAFILSAGIPELLLYETNADRSEALRYNSQLLRPFNTVVKNESLEAADLSELIKKYSSGFLLYADPDRRNEEGNRLWNFTEFQPDARLFHRLVKEGKGRLLVKFSPLDNPEELAAEMPGLSRATLISVHNEVKEVLLFWDFSNPSDQPVFEAVELKNTGEVQTVKIPVERKGIPVSAEPVPGWFLLDPLAALRKGRLAACLAEEQGWKQLSARARLFTIDKKPSDFPGRVFEIVAVHASPSAFRKNFNRNSCHLVCRDFPVGADELRKSLKLREEGNDYLFCFGSESGRRWIVQVRRCS